VGLITHLVAIFENLGETSRTASICLGLIGGLSVVGRLSFGFMADRFSVRKIFTACYIMETIAVSTLLATALIGAKALFVFILIYGLTGGGGLVLAPLLISECFGLKSMGTIFGMLAIAAVIGGATGAVLVGRIVDTTGNYYLAFIIFTIGEAIAATAISQARSPMKGR
jgi:MFS family permease